MRPEKVSRSICWIRRDLRLSDHRALFEACSRSEQVLVVFVYDRVILDALTDRADKRLTFINRSLEEVAHGLLARGSDLITLYGDPLDLIPALAAEWKAEAVFASHDDDPYAISRDAKVAARLRESSVAMETFKDCTVFERQEVLNGEGLPFKVYTPYMKAWRAKQTPDDIAEFTPDLTRLAPASALPAEKRGNKALAEIGFETGDLWLAPGEAGGRQRLEEFLKRIHEYHERRDIPSLPGTSGLSVHLRHGTLSIREAFRRGMELEGEGAKKWVNELIWREFYHMILANFPNVVEEPFQAQYRNLEWPGSDEHFEAWKEGQTGFPIVDAAMRCLNETGWMHNRLRMIVASFLTKDLLVDWRKGEAYMAEKLLDFELSSNNGGWQWSASTGVDAQPYFRVFNPLLQSRKFDPAGDFILQWCPELAGFSGDQVHCPSEVSLLEQISAGCEIGRDYPLPIVEHHVQKERAIQLFRVS